MQVIKKLKYTLKYLKALKINKIGFYADMENLYITCSG